LNEIATLKAAGLSLGSHVRASSVALTIDDGVEYVTWAEIGERLALLVNGSAWWIGDWINYGFAEYGQKYEEALAATGLSYAALTNIAYVCDHVDISRRRENLSFSHHAEVAPLDREAQDTWLLRAETERLSVMALRDAIKGQKALPAHELPLRLTLTLPAAESGRVERWKQAAEAEGEDFALWVAEACDAKAAA
jgi:hypothetical protein